MSVNTIDAIDNIVVASEDFHYELSTLQYLKFGLLSLAGNTREIELKMKKEEGLVFSMGTHMGGALDMRETAILGCFYHWYANSICNYVRLVRYMQGIKEQNEVILNPSPKNKKERDKFYFDYISKVIPEVLTWRNKVTAHFAKTDPRKEDNLATLEASVIFPISFIRPYLKVGGMKWNTNGFTSELPEWSLTKNFESLSPRYWPDVIIPQI